MRGECYQTGLVHKLTKKRDKDVKKPTGIGGFVAVVVNGDWSISGCPERYTPLVIVPEFHIIFSTFLNILGRVRKH